MQDFDQQLQLAQQRRQQFAGQRDFQAPQGKMVGRHFVAPNALEHLAAGLRSFNGIRGQDMAEQEMRDLQGGKQKAIAEALRNFGEMSQGRPADVLPPEQAGPVRPAQAPDTMGAYQALMQAPDAGLRQMGTQGVMSTAQDQAKRTQAQAEQQRLMAILQNSTPQQAISAGVPPELVKSYFESPNIGRSKVKFQDIGGQLVPIDEYGATPQGIKPLQKTGNMSTDLLIPDGNGGFMVNTALMQAKQQVAAAGRAPAAPRQAQIIQTESGPMQLVNGQAVPIMGPDGKPIAGKPAAATGVTPATKTQDARDALATIDMAEKLIGQATGSGIGSATDATAAFFGLSTKGAQAGAQLKALEGDLVAKMPKMSGPQSDKDVLLYRQMAGQIGDPGVPQATKRAALKSIREMQNRYAAGGAQGGATGTFEKPANSIDSLLDKYK